MARARMRNERHRKARDGLQQPSALPEFLLRSCCITLQKAVLSPLEVLYNHVAVWGAATARGQP